MAPALVPATRANEYPASSRDQYCARQPDALHASPFERQVSAELPVVLRVQRIGVPVGLAQVVSGRLELHLELRAPRISPLAVQVDLHSRG